MSNDILSSFRAYKIDQADSLIDLVDDKELKKLYLIELNYISTSKFDTSFVDTIQFFDNKKLIAKQKYMYHYLLGDLNLTQNENDSTAYANYITAIEIALMLKDSSGINHILKKMNHLLFKNGMDLELFRKRVKQYSSQATTNTDKFWALYYKIAIKFREIGDREITEEEIKILDKDFENGFRYIANNEILSAIFFQFKGIYEDVFKRDFQSAEMSYKEALKRYKLFNNAEVKTRQFGTTNNLGVLLFQNRKYEEAIQTFKQLLKNIDDTNNGSIDEMFVNEWLYKSYEAQSKHDSAYFYFKEMVRLKDNLNQTQYAQAVREIDRKYDLKKKEKELETIAKDNKQLEKNLKIVIPILGIISLILLLTYLLYKRYRKKSNKLEEEQSETLQKLDELKKIVIKNHIILKDKTKIYIADLLYIKSDDHYLNIFLSDGKNHFVRGKLSQIKEELPPNFIQCHRSYIVNANFIKQVNSNSLMLIDKTIIPLSRSYKDKF